ncbi:MAG: sensor histidine kinase [Blastococcus sp.]
MRAGTGSLRSRLSWSASLVVALWVLVVSVAANLLLGAVLARQADGVLRARAEATAATVQVSAGGIVTVHDNRDDRALDVGTWIFAADGSAVERPSGSSAALDLEAAALAGHGPHVVDSGVADTVRLLALPVTDHGRQVATVVTSTSLAPYRQVERLTLLGTVVAAVLLLVVVHLVLRVNVSRALRPVQQMSAQAARWSADDIDRRFGPARRPAELAELAGTLDGVLNRLSAVVRHEQQLSAELSHELRTPLARLQAELDWLADRPRDADSVARSHVAIGDAADAMGEILETLMATARTGVAVAPGRCAPAAVVARAVEQLGRPRPGVDVVVDIGPDVTAGIDAPVLVRLLGPLLDNAVRYASRRVTVSGRNDPDGVELVVSDDGPGVPPEFAAHVFEPGRRGDPGDGHDGAGLGLALAGRLACAARGSLTLRPGGPGAAFVVRLPAG